MILEGILKNTDKAIIFSLMDFTNDIFTVAMDNIIEQMKENTNKVYTMTTYHATADSVTNYLRELQVTYEDYELKILDKNILIDKNGNMLYVSHDDYIPYNSDYLLIVNKHACDTMKPNKYISKIHYITISDTLEINDVKEASTNEIFKSLLQEKVLEFDLNEPQREYRGNRRI